MAYSNRMNNDRWQSDSENHHRNNDQRNNERHNGRQTDSRGWDSSRGYGSDLDRDYDHGKTDDRRPNASQHTSQQDPLTHSNNYGGQRNTDMHREYPTHRSGRSDRNNEDDEMRHSYQNRQGPREEEERRLFGGRDYERNYPTRGDRDQDHPYDHSEGWQSRDSQRGYRSLNNTGRTGIGQDNRLGNDRDSRPNHRDQNYNRGDYRVNLSGGGQDYNSRHYYDRDRPGTRLNEYGQRGYSQGYGQTGYSADSQGGEYTNGEVNTRRPKNYKGDDERIYVEACESLGREMDASTIEVQCSNNEITLIGSVKSKSERRHAEHIVDRIMGVKDIHNRLTVEKGSSQDKQDDNTVSASE